LPWRQSARQDPARSALRRTIGFAQSRACRCRGPHDRFSPSRQRAADDRVGDVGGVRIRLRYAGGGRVQSPQIRARQGRSSTGGRSEPLHRHRVGLSRRHVSPAIGDKRVSDQRRHACFHERMLHQTDARFATPALIKGGATALVLSPRRSRPRRRRRTIAFDGIQSPGQLEAGDRVGDEAQVCRGAVLAARPMASKRPQP
jgi:hypothetical protein